MKRRNEKWLDELIYRSINRGEPRFDSERWKQKYPEEFQMLQSQTQRTLTNQRNLWGKIMKSKITKYAVAAIILIAAGISIAVLDETGEQVEQDTVQVAEESSPQMTTDAVEGGDSDLSAQLEQVRLMYVGGDIDGLVAMLSEAEYQTKVAAANYLAEIGDDSALATLKILSSEYGDANTDNPFADAIEKIEAIVVVGGGTKVVLVVLVLLIVVVVLVVVGLAVVIIISRFYLAF